MRLTNLTPEELRCPWGDCPAVWKDENGRLFIIGEDVTTIPDQLKGKYGANERIVAIDPQFFKHIPEFKKEESESE